MPVLLVAWGPLNISYVKEKKKTKTHTVRCSEYDINIHVNMYSKAQLMLAVEW